MQQCKKKKNVNKKINCNEFNGKIDRHLNSITVCKKQSLQYPDMSCMANMTHQFK